jgi:hypothetical protein
MKHKIVSFYKTDLPTEVVDIQKKVFDKFEIPLEQISFTAGHSEAIEQFLNITTDYDLLTIFDVDCIPIKSTFLQKIYDNVKDDMTIYGNAQSSNTTIHNIHKSPPFIAPSFLNFTKKLYDSSPTKSFAFQMYPNPDGVNVEADVAEVFSRENEKRGVVLKYAYPTKTHGDQYWENDGRYGNVPFKYGQYTEFESDTYHHYFIRSVGTHTKFIEYCNEIIKYA